MLRIHYDELETDVDGVYYWEAKPFTGIAYEQYPNGTPVSQIVNGVWIRGGVGENP